MGAADSPSHCATTESTDTPGRPAGRERTAASDAPELLRPCAASAARGRSCGQPGQPGSDTPGRAPLHHDGRRERAAAFPPSHCAFPLSLCPPPTTDTVLPPTVPPPTTDTVPPLTALTHLAVAQSHSNSTDTPGSRMPFTTTGVGSGESGAAAETVLPPVPPRQKKNESIQSELYKNGYCSWDDYVPA